jgi:predicted nucleic-acid-binding Zn-ribbon protein
MKNTNTCPKCQSRQLWLIDQVNQPDVTRAGPGVPMRVTTAGIDTPLGGYYELEAGRFEAWVCVLCGFTEWYAKEANEVLAKLARYPGGGVRLIDTSGQRGPFR